jgi:hypothetical protein
MENNIHEAQIDKTFSPENDYKSFKAVEIFYPLSNRTNPAKVIDQFLSYFCCLWNTSNLKIH